MANTKKTGIKPTMQNKYPRTISQEMYDAWQLLRRTGDPAALCKKLKYCRPIIDRALNYGHVANPKLADKISKYFSDRLDGEKDKGTKMIKKAKKKS